MSAVLAVPWPQIFAAVCSQRLGRKAGGDYQDRACRALAWLLCL